MQIDAFCSTMEGMKQVSGNYLKMEKGYAENWANYIERQNMTMDEAWIISKTAILRKTGMHIL